jgi:DNA-binding Lrp family transcriptional regulator
MTLSEASIPILVTLWKIEDKHGKDYSFPSQETILLNMSKYYGAKKSRATLNRRLRKMEDAGLIKRTRRIRRTKEHGLEFKSTMYMILMSGFKMLANAGHQVWHKIKHLINKFNNKFTEFAARSTKKMLSAVKPNPKDGEHIQKIFNSLAENLSANR